MILAYIPCSDEAEARRIAKALIMEKLAACAGMWPMRSLFKWRGELADEAETALLLKAPEENYSAVEKRVRELHSYELPAIVRIDAKVNKDYEKWLKETCE